MVHCDIDVERIAFESGEYVLVDGKQLLGKPLHAMALINSCFTNEDPEKLVWLYRLCQRFFDAASQIDAPGPFNEACKAVDNHRVSDEVIAEIEMREMSRKAG